MKWYYGPWVWDKSHWRAPRGCTGLDLRTLPEQGQQGGSPGLSLFAGDLAENAADYTTLGEGDWSEVHLTTRGRHLLGHGAEGDTLAEAVLSVLSERSDPRGHDAPRPIIPAAGGRIDLHCAGLVAPASMRWGQRHTNRVRDVLRNDFAAAWEVNPTNARKVLDYWQAKHGADWRQFVPPSLLPHVPGPLPHETTITDTFDRADGPIGTSSGGWSWSNVTGTWNIYSNAAGTSAGSGWLSCRAQSDLSSTDQYSQVIIGLVKEYYGPSVRVDASAITFYQFSADTTRYLFKLVAGVQTVIASTAGTQVGGQTWKVQANGSTIKGYVNAAEILSVTDTAISSGLRAGIAGNGTSGYGTFASFEAADLLPPAPVNTVAPAITPTSGTAGSQQFTCSTGTWDNSPSGYAYQWKLDGGNVGTDANTYTPVAAGSLTCVVTASNAGGSTPATSNTATVNPPAPVNTVAPAITPTSGETGEQFTCTTGTWTNSPSGYAYQWKLDGSNVGTNANTYTPVAAGSLTCVVTATNAGGSTPATSNAATVTAPSATGGGGNPGMKSALSGMSSGLGGL